MNFPTKCLICGSEELRPVGHIYKSFRCQNCNQIIETAEKFSAIPEGFEKSKQAEFQNPQTAGVDGKPSVTPTPLMVGCIPADKLLLLTDEQDSDSLALRKLKRALTRKQLVQVREEIATLQKAVQVEMGEDYWRWSWK